MDDIQAQLAAYKKSQPVLPFRVKYKGDLYDVLARDESEVHAELSAVLDDYNAQKARVVANV